MRRHDPSMEYHDPLNDREGLGLVEGFRGDVLAAVRIEDSIVGHCHLHDPRSKPDSRRNFPGAAGFAPGGSFVGSARCSSGRGTDSKVQA